MTENAPAGLPIGYTVADQALAVDYRPRLPSSRLGIAIVGTGAIVREAHLPAYRKVGFAVAGLFNRSAAAAHAMAREFGVGKVYSTLNELLTDPAVSVVDVATPPAVRGPIIMQALEAGKHVLAQKPLAASLEEAKAMVQLARSRGLKLAVNQNGRWAPPWNIATELVRRGVVGEVTSLTHFYDTSMAWSTGRGFDRIPHALLYDYSIHWIDISRCWLASKQVVSVRARESRSFNQPTNSVTPWCVWVEIECSDGTSAMIRGVGCSATGQQGHQFWIHGSLGTIRGSVMGSDFVELQKGDLIHRYMLKGGWIPDGFVGTMGELLSAIEEDRQPSNSADDNLLSLQLTLAACQSAEDESRPVPISLP